MILSLPVIVVSLEPLSFFSSCDFILYLSSLESRNFTLFFLRTEYKWHKEKTGKRFLQGKMITDCLWPLTKIKTSTVRLWGGTMNCVWCSSESKTLLASCQERKERKREHRENREKGKQGDKRDGGEETEEKNRFGSNKELLIFNFVKGKRASNQFTLSRIVFDVFAWKSLWLLSSWKQLML